MVVVREVTFAFIAPHSHHTPCACAFFLFFVSFTPSMMREASYSSMRMGFYDTVKILIAPKSTSKDEFTLGQKMAAGCISGAMGSVIATPTDLVKVSKQKTLI